MKNQENSVMLIESKKNNNLESYKDSNKKFTNKYQLILNDYGYF